MVLKKNSMLSDGLSHVGFGAFALASALELAPLPIAIPLVILSSILILRFSQSNKIHNDALIALISTSSLAVGTIIVSLTGSNIDINSYLFGSILAINLSELIMSFILTLIVLIVYLLFHNQIFALTFDEKFAHAIGINTKLLGSVFAILCSFVVVLGIRLVGTLLISALIVFPTLSARTIFQSFKKVIISSGILSIITFLFGLIISYLFSIPTGATIVVINLLIFLILQLLNKCFK